MGSACCVAAKDTTLPSQTSAETIRRGVIYSPSWSFQWDNRRHVAGKIDDTYDPSEGNISHSQLPIKESLFPGRGYVLDGMSQVANMGSPISQRSPIHDITRPGSLTLSSGTSNNSAEVRLNGFWRIFLRWTSWLFCLLIFQLKNVPSPESAAPKKSFASTLSSFLTPLAENLSPNIDSIPLNPAPSLGQKSPVPQLVRESSDSQIREINSPCSNLLSEGRPSFVFSPCSNGFTTGSQGGFSDRWSMRTFSELVASSQKERWSFESEQLSSACGKISESSSRFSCSPSFKSRACAVCSKLLTERSLFGCRSNEISVAAVLVCGHLYHGECLEILTPDKDRYDPTCPICTMGKKRMLKMCKKALKAEAERKSRNRKIFNRQAVDGFFGRELKFSDYGKGGEWKGKVPRLEVSSSSKSSFTTPFLRRHFSLRSKWGRSLSVNEPARKKSFWSRSRGE